MKRIISTFRHSKLTVAGIIVLLLFGLAAIFSSWLSPHNPWYYFEPFLAPSASHLLGTNDVGQDILSELIYGTRISLLVGILAAVIATGIGLVIGILAGFQRGYIDNVLMGFTDIVLIIPALPLVILLSAYIGPNIWVTIVVIGFVFWPGTTRVIRSQVLSIRESGYVESIRALGAGDIWIMRRHVFPNVLPMVMAKFVLTVAAALLMETSLSFLGLGDPSAKSWGMMLHYAFSRGGFIRNLWWWYLPPGLSIAAFILAMTMISFGIESKSDPRLKKALEK